MAASVLVVDDDRDIRDAIAQILTEEGFEVSEAGNGQQALAEIARKMPDLVLLDLMMPVMNGWQVLQALRQTAHLSKLPVVVLSAIEAHGCPDYIQKPVSLDRLLALIDTVRARTALTS
jgi:DNA-binding response OmpR family regulator